MLEILFLSFIILFLYFSGFYLLALKQGIYNTVDIAYGTSFILIALYALFISDSIFIIRKLLTTVFVILWGIRIAYFLTIRKYGKDRETGEDKRFKILRNRWGKSSIWKGFIILYIPQVFTVLLVSFPILIINTYNDSPDLTILDLIALTVVLIAILGETISDYQLYRFKNDPNNSGKIFSGGLWKYSQHPNYFFEIVTWWAFWVLAIVSVPSSQILWGIIAIIGPLVLTFSLLEVSGIPLLKRRFESESGYSEYQKRTPLLIPWIPKK